MRSEEQMLNLIVETARADARIRAAFLQGSRTNPNAPRDIFQDFDVIYVVDETRPFREDRRWIDRFGKRLYMQYPEENPDEPSDVENCYGWLMQLADGNRLDLHVCTWKGALSEIARDGAFRVLLDKDGCLPQKNRETDEAFRVRPFTAAQFACAVNEFWWCTNNVAKGLWRGELPYVMDMLNLHARPMLTRLLAWKVGLDTRFLVSPGKSGKYLGRFLPEEAWRAYLATYAAAKERALWQAVFTMCDLVEATAEEIAERTGYPYDAGEARAARGHLAHVRALPKDAPAVYGEAGRS